MACGSCCGATAWSANGNDPLVAPANTYDTVTNEVAGSLYFAFNKYGIEIEQQLGSGKLAWIRPRTSPRPPPIR